KTRLYRIPTYISIVEGCLSNLFRVITLLLDQTTTKDYKTQNKLSPLCTVLKNNDFELLVRDVDVDVRHAINHGGVVYKIVDGRSEEHTSELQSRFDIVCRLLLD